MAGYATVYLLDLPFSADRPFLYSLPPALGGLRPGQFVYVPFGRGNPLMIIVRFPITFSLPQDPTVYGRSPTPAETTHPYFLP